MCLDVVLPSCDESFEGVAAHYNGAGLAPFVVACRIACIGGWGWCMEVCSHEQVLQVWWSPERQQ